MANEKLCLKWNDFHSLVQVSFGELRTDNDFTDVTLAAWQPRLLATRSTRQNFCDFSTILGVHPQSTAISQKSHPK